MQTGRRREARFIQLRSCIAFEGMRTIFLFRPANRPSRVRSDSGLRVEVAPVDGRLPWFQARHISLAKRTLQA